MSPVVVAEQRSYRAGGHRDAVVLARLIDEATVDVVGWSTGRRLWAAGIRDRYAAVATYDDDGPPFVLLEDAIPGDLLDLIDTGQWTNTAGVTSQALPIGVPDFDAAVADLVTDTVSRRPWTFPLEPQPLMTYLAQRTVGAGSELDGHRDDHMDPYRRWVGLVGYLTDPASYEGGAIVMDATGERLRPARGAVVLLRGDTVHHVEPVTSGERVTLSAFVPEPRPWLLPP